MRKFRFSGTLSIHSHVQSFYFYSLVFSFALPTYFSALFTSRSAGYRGTLHDSPNRCCVLSFICALNIA